MATLRLFANLRESAGTDRATFEASTVGDLIAAAEAEFGATFAAGVTSARVWVNGEQASMDVTVTDADEVALIPPVSGGATPMSTSDAAPNLLAVALVVALLAVGWSRPAWYVLVAVGAILAWVWDVSETAETVGHRFEVYPPLVGAAAAGAGSYAWGFEGFAGGIAIGVIVSVAWPIFVKSARDIRRISATTLVTLVAEAAAAGLVLVRLLGPHAVVAFVLVAVFTLVGAWTANAYGAQIQSIDANVGALLGALLAGLIAGMAIEQLDVAAGLLGGVATAAGVIAGRAFGSMLRTGEVTHTESAPGSLTMFDGVVVAAPLFWLALWIFG